MNYLCADCGIEREDMSKCQHCNSIRVVSKTFVENTLGENWRTDSFPENIFPDAWKQIGWRWLQVETQHSTDDGRDYSKPTFARNDYHARVYSNDDGSIAIIYSIPDFCECHHGSIETAMEKADATVSKHKNLFDKVGDAKHEVM